MIDFGNVRSYIEGILFPYYAQLQSNSESFRESFIRDLERVAKQRTLSYESANRHLLSRTYSKPSVKTKIRKQ